MVKVVMNTKTTIKQHLVLFSTKFDSDFASFKLTARIKIKGNKEQVPIDAPIRNIIADFGLEKE